MTGLFSVGGGLATLPFLYDISARTGWFTTSDIANMIAISESTPGPLGINMATYVGYITAWIPGSIIASVSLVFPSIIIIMIISKILTKFKDSVAVQRIFYGLRPASTGLIAAAGLGVAKIAFFKEDIALSIPTLPEYINWKLVLLAVVIWFTYRKFKKHPIIYIAASALAGIIFQL